MLVVSIRALILYLVVLVTMRIMGKRELGQLQPYEFVIAIMMADLAATPMADTGVPIFHGVVPILVLLLVYLLLSWIMLKSEKARAVICGRPAVIIAQGKVLEHEMRRARYNFDDLLEQVHEMGYFSLIDVEYAILETSGVLTVLPRQEKAAVTTGDLGIYRPQVQPACHVILDGRMHRQSLLESGYTEAWLREELARQGFTDPRDIYFAVIRPDGTLFAQERERRGRWWGA